MAPSSTAPSNLASVRGALKSALRRSQLVKSACVRSAPLKFSFHDPCSGKNGLAHTCFFKVTWSAEFDAIRFFEHQRIEIGFRQVCPLEDRLAEIAPRRSAFCSWHLRKSAFSRRRPAARCRAYPFRQRWRLGFDSGEPFRGKLGPFLISYWRDRADGPDARPKPPMTYASAEARPA